MKYRKLADREVSALGFGCMRLPVIGGNESRIDESEATRMLRYAIDHGVNYIDTAWPYHGGESEPFIGRALQRGYRAKVYLATKLPSWLVETQQDCDRYLNEQLKRLQTDQIEFYLLHSLDRDRWPKLESLGGLEFLDRAVKDGRIGCAGFSYHDELQYFKLIIDAYDWAFCQIQYNYVDEEFQAGTEGLKYAVSKGVDVVVMEPLRGGKLTKRLPREAEAVLEESGIDRTPAGLALRWVWDHPEVSCVLSGMSAMDHVVENCRMADDSDPDSLTEEERRLIGRIREILAERTVVPCTNCGYCLPCPEGVAIPEILSTYNDLHIYDDPNWARGYYRVAIRPERRADKCVECGECEEKCPQGIGIMELLRESHRALTGSGS